MNVTILEAGNLPSDAFLSVRVGDAKRMRPFKVGESFAFAKVADTSSPFIQLDAFEKLGSLMARGLQDPGDDKATMNELLQHVSIPTARGASISAKIKVAFQEPQPPERHEKPQTRHKLALDAKNYLDGCDVWGPIQGMLHALLKCRPQDPVGFMLGYLNDIQRLRPGTDSAAAEGEPISWTASTAPSAWSPKFAPAQEREQAKEASPAGALASKAGAGGLPSLPAELRRQARRSLLEGLESGGLEKACRRLRERRDAAAAGVAAAAGPRQLPEGEAAAPSGGLGVYAAFKELPAALGAEEGVDDGGCPGHFPRGACPDELPDLAGHHSMMVSVLRGDPSIYRQLKDRRTRLGVSLAPCIKSGMDNPGHQMLMSVGLVAGDEECYEAFRELFDPVIEARHGIKMTGLRQPLDLAAEKVIDTEIDPTGRYAISTRVRSSRSLRGFRMPPACCRTERRSVEGALAEALSGIQDEDLKGTYHPLMGSCSYPSKPNGMSPKEEEALEQQGFLFLEPDSSVLLCSGVGRDWPDARGVFAATSQKLVAWVNEEDHLRLVSLQPGGDLKQAFGRFARCALALERGLAAQGRSFARSERLGYASSCPSNLGTGLRASVLLRLPLLSRHPRFQEAVRGLGLQASNGLATSLGRTMEPGVCDVANRARLGASEVEQVSDVVRGCARLVAMEQALERGEEP